MNKEEWYYAEDGEQIGPTSSEEIRRLVAAGKVLADDLVWREGMDDWLPAGKIPGLLVAKKKPKPAGVKPKAEWYYALDGEQVGPISESELREKVKQQKILTDDMIWREGMAEWLPAGQVPEPRLFPKKAKPSPKNAASDSTSPRTESSKQVEQPATMRSKSKSPRQQSQAAASPPEENLFEPPEEAESFEALEEDEDWEQSEAYLQQKEEELFGEISSPAQPSRRSSARAEEPRVTEIIREVTKEKSVYLSADAQLSKGALFLQLLCWTLCGLVAAGGAAYCTIFHAWTSVPVTTAALYGTAAAFVVSQSVQRCLELASQMKRRR